MPSDTLRPDAVAVESCPTDLDLTRIQGRILCNGDGVGRRRHDAVLGQPGVRLSLSDRTTAPHPRTA
ncbi:MAG TPA: hypothetical protein VIR30_06730 [Nocardioides sp.]